MRPRAVAVAASVLVLVLVMTVRALVGPAPAEAPPPSGPREHLRLAQEGSLHFVLDTEARSLTLFRGAAPLRTWPLESVHAGPRRLGPWFSDIEEDWHTRAWPAPSLEPPVRIQRLVIESDSVVPPDPSDTEAVIPLPPEELVPTPARFVAHYAGGLGLEVVAVGADAPSRGLMTRVASALGVPGFFGDRFRVRVTMEASEAGALYRAFPAEAALVILVPAPVTLEDDTQ